MLNTRGACITPLRAVGLSIGKKKTNIASSGRCLIFHLAHGRPLLLKPFGCQFKTTLAQRLLSIDSTLLNHLFIARSCSPTHSGILCFCISCLTSFVVRLAHSTHVPNAPLPGEIKRLLPTIALGIFICVVLSAASRCLSLPMIRNHGEPSARLQYEKVSSTNAKELCRQ